MEIEAAVFCKLHEPLTIETVEIDKPSGREVLVATAATGVCHSDCQNRADRANPAAASE